MRKDSIKNIRINQEVQKELSELIRSEVKDPRIHPFTSIQTVKGLKNAASFLRSRRAGSMNMRNTPELRFIADDSIAYGIEMSRKIDEVAATLPADEEESAENSEGSEDTDEE